MSVLSSYDNMLAVKDKMLRRSFFDIASSAPPTATTTAGYQKGIRLPKTITIPSLSGYTGYVFPAIDMTCEAGGLGVTAIAALDYTLGTVTANGGTGSFASGSSMPSKTVNGSSITTASQAAFAVVNTTMVGAGTYTLTITYTNQAGTGSRTCTITVPNVSGTQVAFYLNPHLQAGDTGIRSVSNITLTGTSGVIEIHGLLVLATAMTTSGASNLSPESITIPHIMWLCEAGDTIAFYGVGLGAATTRVLAFLPGVPES